MGESRFQFPGASSSLHSDAGLDDVLDEPCDGQLDDAFVPELDDNLHKYEIFPFFQKIVFPCLVNRGCSPLAHS